MLTDEMKGVLENWRYKKFMKVIKYLQCLRRQFMETKELNKKIFDVQKLLGGENKDLAKAKEELENVINEFDNYNLGNTDECYAFNNIIEYTFLSNRSEVPQKVKWLDVSINFAYFELAYICNEQGEFDKAIEIKKILRI